MFNRVISLHNTKTWQEALLFFCFHVVMVFILVFVITFIFSDYAAFSPDGTKLGQAMAAVATLVYFLVLNCMLLAKKKLYKNFWYSFFVVLSPTLGIVSLFIAAFLTTRSAETSGHQLEVGGTSVVL